MALPGVMIDGFNLGLERGTGVATYARNLSLRVGALGHPVDVVYGSKNRVGRNKLLSEIGFFDPGGQSLTRSKVVRALATSPFGVEVRQVPITGRVISRTFASRLPHFDRLFNSPDLYSLSRHHFQLYRSFMPVKYENPARIAHWTYPLPIALKGAANLHTIHDLVPLRLPYTTLDNKKHYYQVIRRICETSDHIVTVSEASKRDIVELFGVSEDRVTNTYQSASLPPSMTNRPEKEVADEVSAIFELDYKDYFLFYGAIEPKKNVGRIIEAYLSSQAKIPLVIVGSLTWKDANDLRLIDIVDRNRTPTSRLPASRFSASRLPSTRFGKRKSGSADDEEVPGTIVIGKGAGGTMLRGDRIVRLEYLPLSLLVSLIRGARGVVFPSLYEGFGLPILEAMQLGTAVITGTEGSNPEVAGDGALLVDPYDVKAITKAIRAFTDDPGLVDHYVKAGRARAEAFSPEAYDARLKALYARFT